MALAWPVIKDLLALRDRLNRLFEETFLEESPGVGEPSSGPFCPASDLYETGDEVVIIMEVPGVEPQSIELRLSGDTLRIDGHIGAREVSESGRYVRMERATGPFYRVFDLPVGMVGGEPEARLERGALTIRLPKVAEDVRRRVTIVEEAT